MYIFGLSSVLFIQNLSASKEFKSVKRGFGEKIRNTIRNSMCQIWKQKQFYSKWKKIQVSHSLVIVFQWVFILVIFITTPVNPFSFLHNTVVIWSSHFHAFWSNYMRNLRLFLVTPGATLKMGFWSKKKRVPHRSAIWV